MTSGALHRPAWVGEQVARERVLRDHEWLLTNGLGGYSSGTIAEVMTRKYHGYLIAALPSPFGRMVMLQDVGVTVHLPSGRELALSGEDRAGVVRAPSERVLRDFRLESGLPVWEFDIDGLRIEKRVVMSFGSNTVYASYRVVDEQEGSEGTELVFRPFLHVRGYEEAVTTPHPPMRVLHLSPERLEVQVAGDIPPLRILATSGSFEHHEAEVAELAYRVERDRGYEWMGSVWSPGTFTVPLIAGQEATLVSSTEPWQSFEGISFREALAAERERRAALLLAASTDGDEVVERLALAADQFIITPVGRQEDEARAKAAGDEARTVIAGYHWFTDWGRDTMISLEGLTLSTGRHAEARYILRTFAHHVRDGLIPNMFPDGENEGLYHTADATLWFFHAVHRYVEATGDRQTLRAILPRLREIISAHEAGTHFGIGVDPSDSLLRQGAPGYQLTWMDAKVDGWVVTPRRGKAVEINALWYNAVRLMASFERDEGNVDAANRLESLAARTRESFNLKFWGDESGHLYDVIEGEDGGSDGACRPNQIFAIALDHPVLVEARWRSVFDTVRDRLLTPVGLRSLAPGHSEYKPKYFGDLRARDAAYHQGTVWGWLIGPFVDAWLRVYPDDRAGARNVLHAMVERTDDFGVGSVAEIFDAESPYTARGCIAQAWSVAELLRAWRLTSAFPKT